MSVSQIDWTGAFLLAGRYQILRRLGEGGMALVYLAKDRKLDMQVVIKVPQAEVLNHPNFAGRFQREIRLMVRLSHKHIVRVLDTDMHEGAPFAVLEYLAGGTLRDQQLRDPSGKALPMPVESLHTWLGDIASALDYIHECEYIHRDVKPANILLDKQDHVYLADFGIAKTLSDPTVGGPVTTYTQQGTILGTPQYMAPEMILGKNFDHRVDQYALAVTIYECLAGRYPFDGPNPTAIFVQQAKEAAPFLNDLVKGIPKKLALAVNRGLNKQAGQRFKSCTEFAKMVLAETPTPKRGRAVISAPVIRAGEVKAKAKVDTAPLQNATPSGDVAPIPYECPRCMKKMMVRLHKPHHRFRCPHCRTSFSVAAPPPPPAVLRRSNAEQVKPEPNLIPPPLPPPQAELVEEPMAMASPYPVVIADAIPAALPDEGHRALLVICLLLLLVMGGGVAAAILLFLR